MAGVQAAKHYRGAVAQQYDADRLAQPKWAVEQRVVKAMLSAFPKGTTLVDVPVGTGRFLEFYREFGIEPTGIDVSTDMIAEARAKAERLGLAIAFETGAIQSLPVADDSFDLALCIRLMNLVEFSIVRAAIKELARVSRQQIIIGIRHYNSLGELGRRPGQIIQQIWFRLRRLTGQRDFIVHRKEDILAAFENHDLEIIEAVSIDRERGTELTIYRLAHRNAGT